MVSSLDVGSLQYVLLKFTKPPHPKVLHVVHVSVLAVVLVDGPPGDVIVHLVGVPAQDELVPGVEDLAPGAGQGDAGAAVSISLAGERAGVGADDFVGEVPGVAKKERK